MKNGWNICKQWKSCDATFCGVWSGSALFASYPFRGLQSSMGERFIIMMNREGLLWPGSSRHSTCSYNFFISPCCGNPLEASRWDIAHIRGVSRKTFFLISLWKDMQYILIRSIILMFLFVFFFFFFFKQKKTKHKKIIKTKQYFLVEKKKKLIWSMTKEIKTKIERQWNKINGFVSFLETKAVYLHHWKVFNHTLICEEAITNNLIMFDEILITTLYIRSQSFLEPQQWRGGK